ncbi:hypothetical protein [Epilithonimonas caeni]|uniref:hypothetical protein n=1 Tax=Epilithonimonas caeni TaxID=365343 RepID=UPI0004855985|nr:hypothetical protein [Epilithonimonas caeni]
MNKKKTIRIILIIILLLIFVKGFMGIVRYSDDPTVSLALKFNPFSDNVIHHQILLDSTSQYIVIASDENEIIGEKIFLAIFNLNFFFLIIAFLLLYYTFQKKR